MRKTNRLTVPLLALTFALASHNASAAPTDSDGDGVHDSIDRCEDEVETINGFMDDDGCADLKPAYPLSSGKPLVMHNVIFLPGKAELDPTSYTYLDLVAESLFVQSNLRIRIEAYTDSPGKGKEDLMLSWQRGLAVLNYLVMQGVDKARLEYQGYGDTRPLVADGSPADRLRNRRIEFHVVGQ